MRLDDFDFDLPERLIAQFPPQHREDSRLMVVPRSGAEFCVTRFPQIVDYFREGDLLVLNDTRVIPARLLGRKETGGRIEVFLVRRLQGEREDWICMTRSSKPPRPGARLELGEGLEAIVLGEGDPPYQQVRFFCEEDFTSMLERIGRIPLPPYIRRDNTAEDRERYQTVFARSPGAVAAPTAGLHFTPEILAALESRGVIIAALTLHVGLGTFLPVRVEDVREHRMHGEAFQIPTETADAVNTAKREGRRVIALGTTSTRVLEYALDDAGRSQAGEGVSDLFIYPGFRFRIVDGLVTNFHLPRSTLLMLVSALAGRERTLGAYRQAVAEGFRFFSYGDCMLVL